MGPFYEDTPYTTHGLNYTENCTKVPFEMRTPPLIRTLIQNCPKCVRNRGIPLYLVFLVIIIILCINTAGGTATTASIATTSVPSTSTQFTALTDDEDTTTTAATAVNATRAELITSEYQLPM